MTKERIVESNRSNAKDHALERLTKTDTRDVRPLDRDIEVVKLPDGKEFVRTARTSIRRHGRFDLPKKTGFLRRWVSGNLPNELQNVIDLGYKPATNENGTEYAPVRGGTNKLGETFSLYPMEISEEMYKKIERDNKAKIQNKNKESLENMSNDFGDGLTTYVSKDLLKTIKQ